MDNQTMLQYFEWYLPPDGVLWRRLACQAPTLKEEGFDIIWMPPAYKGAAGGYDVGYGVYDLYDLGEFDQKGTVPTKYGTKAEYQAAVKAVQASGMLAVADTVLNQRLGADETQTFRATEVEPFDRGRDIGVEHDITAWTKYTCPGRKDKYSTFSWQWYCFTGTDWDEGSHRNGIFRFEGKNWSGNVSSEYGNYDYLMGCDVDVNAPFVREELVRWGQWYLQETGVNGFRLDAVKHIDHGFISEWLDEMRKASGKKDLFTVGEYWSGDVKDLQGFLQQCNGCLTLFDVPLHMRFHDASNARGNYDMGALLQGTLVEAAGGNAVTFVENHDSQPGQALESPVMDWFKPLAYAIILLRREGLPCIFYADLYGMRGDGVGPVPGLRRMLQVRKKYAYGAQHDYFDHQNIVGWTREGDEAHPNSGCAVLVTDQDGGEKQMYVGKQFAGHRFRDVVRRIQDPITVDANGNANFKVTGGGVCVWVTEEAYQDIVIHFE